MSISVCPQCGHNNPANIPLCLNCATSLDRTCPSCKGKVQGDDRFCRLCGTRLDNSATQMSSPYTDSLADPRTMLHERLISGLREGMPMSLAQKIDQVENRYSGQRRDITVLSIELGGLGTAAQTIGSEEAYLLTDRIIHLLADIIYKYEGIIDRFTGESILALFGLPINHENDPERAVRAALEIEEVVRQNRAAIKKEFHLDFWTRMGVNTGTAIAGNLNSQRHMEYTVIGDTVNLASRLQVAAEQGATLVTFRTYQRTRPIFDYQILPPLTVESYQVPVEIFRPVRISAVPGEVRGLPGLYAQMVGREEDFNRLQEALRAVREEKRGQVVFINGHAGIGKTRLVAEFRSALAGQPVEVHLGTCTSYMRITPFRVLADILRNILHIFEMDPIEVQRGALISRLEKNGLDQPDMLSYLSNVLGIPQQDPVSEVRIKLLDPSMLQRQIQSAVRAFLLAEAQFTTTVLIFDDLHWVDPASLSFLEYFSQSLSNTPILLVLISREFERDAETYAVVQLIEKKFHNPTRIQLKPLSSRDSRMLLDQLITQETPDFTEIKERIIQRAAGSPYYTEELVRVLIDHGGLAREEGRWNLTGQAGQLIEEVPGTLQDIFLARFDRLPTGLQRMLQICSVLRGAIIPALLCNICDEPWETILLMLQDLEKRDFLSLYSLGENDVYSFKHPLLQETIYNTMLNRDSRALHQRIAQAVENQVLVAGGEHNEMLAYHFSESSTPEKAIPYLLQAAEIAEKHFAHETAVQHYRKCLSLLETQTQPNLRLINKARIGLGKGLKFTGDFEAAVHAIEPVTETLISQAGQEDFEQLGGMTLLLPGLRELADIRTREGKLDLSVDLLQEAINLLRPEMPDASPVETRRTLDRLAWVYFRLGRLEEAFQLADMALIDEQSWEAEDPITIASLSNTIGGILYMRSRPHDAVEYVERGLRTYQSLNYHWGIAIAYTNLGVLNHALGKWREAVEDFERADEIRRDYGYIPERPVNLKNSGEVLLCMGDHDQAREKLVTSLEISRWLGMDIFSLYAVIGLCRLALIQKDLPKAQYYLTMALDLTTHHSGEADDRIIQVRLLEALLNLEKGNYHQALEQASSGYQMANSGGFLSEKSDALRVLGKVYARLEDFEQAESALKRSVELAQSQSNTYHQAMALYELGSLYAKQPLDTGRLALAREPINQAIELFSRLGARHDMGLAQTVRSSIPGPSSFTISRAGLASDSDQTRYLHSSWVGKEGEWYQTTVLHLCLAPTAGADEELVFETIALLLPALDAIFHEYGGEVIHQQNDLVVVFGFPIARENDTEQAVEAAIQVSNYCQELYNQTQMPLTVCLGLASGKVVASYSGIGDREGFIAAGEPLLVASKLAEAATPFRVWVTQQVRDAAAFRFQFGPTHVGPDDRSDPSRPIQLEGLRDQIIPVRGLIGLRSPFIGRQEELAAMITLVENLGKYSGGLIFLEGEPGIGKSRLMCEFADNAMPKNALIWHGTCSPRRSKQAFSLFSDVATHIFDLQPNDKPEHMYDAIEAKMLTWPEELAETRPFLEVLAGVRPSGDEGERLLTLEPEQFRRQVFVALRRVIGGLALQQPIILLLDDLQWIDPVSADLVLFLANLTLNYPVLFVCTLRSTEESQMAGTLERIHQMHSGRMLQISVQPLNNDEAGSLLEEFLSSANLPVSIHQLIIRQSGGNPYFIEEFVRMMIEQDYLRLNRGQMEINQTFEIDALQIPTSLETLIRARIDALPSTTRKLLQVASVIGQSFTETLLVSVAGQNEVSPHLNLLQARGMIKLGEANHLEFTHQLIETIVYNTVLKAHRQLIHQRAAFALEQQWQGQEAEHAEDLAYHFRQAGENAKTLFYLVLAGERAAARYSNDAALNHFRDAHELLDKIPDVGDRLRWRIACGLGEVNQFIGNFEASIEALKGGLTLLTDSYQLSTAQIAGLERRLGETYLKTGDYEAAYSCFEDALQTLKDGTTPQDTSERARILLRTGWGHFMQSRLDSAREIISNARLAALAEENLSIIALSDNMLGGISFRQGAFNEAVQHTQQAIAGWEKMGYSWGVAAALGNLGILEAVAGNWSEAERFFQRGLALRQEMGDVEGVAIMLNNLGQLTRDKGQLDQAEGYLRNSLALAQPFQLTYHAGVSAVSLSQVLLYQGRFEESRSLIEQGMVTAGEIEARDLYCELLRTRAELLIASGDPAGAKSIVRQAAEIAVNIGDQTLLAGCWRVATDALLQQGKAEEARTMLQQALSCISADSGGLEAGRVSTQAARLYSRLGERELAEEHCRRAAQIFSSLGALRDLRLLQSYEEILTFE